MKYLAVLGRQPLISLAELESLYQNVRPLSVELAEFETEGVPNIRRLGGSQKIAKEISGTVLEFLDKIKKSLWVCRIFRADPVPMWRKKRL
jgi:hypothetical protein